ncbi:MAG: hypothetical protein ACRC0Q_09815 [Kurthia gibsonii]
MDLCREIELKDSVIVRKELEKVINISIIGRISNIDDKLTLLDKWSAELARGYSTEELSSMLETLEKEEYRDSFDISKWIGFVALGVATITLFCTMFIALYDSLDEKDVEIKINIALGINFIIFSIPTAFILIKTISIYRLESKQYKTRSIFIALINAALKQKV